jgi:hypothetical protein
MITKPYDLSEAIPYHTGEFPSEALDYETLLGPLEEAAAALARYDPSPLFPDDRFVEKSGIPASSARSLSRRLLRRRIASYD